MIKFIEQIESVSGNLSLFVLPMVIAFLITAVLGPVLIPWLTKLKFGQQILEIGPNWHKKKAGTPTMGGIMFIAGAVVAVEIALLVKADIRLLMMLLVSLGFGLIGFVDDYVKVVKKRNLGLSAGQKFTLQAILAIIYVLVLSKTGNLDNQIIIPFMKSVVTIPWWLYIILILFVVTGTVNAVNLTDGLDGLATSITVVVSAFFAVAAILAKDSTSSIFAMAVLGGCLGFLIYNRHPAKVFMGDTGSLFLGGAVSVLAIGLKMPIILVIAGFVYLFEALSVIMQVTSFKLTGKRIFKMSPIHHHFEMCGWREVKIVTVFTTATLLLCALAVIAILPSMVSF